MGLDQSASMQSHDAKTLIKLGSAAVKITAHICGWLERVTDRQLYQASAGVETFSTIDLQEVFEAGDDLQVNLYHKEPQTKVQSSTALMRIQPNFSSTLSQLHILELINMLEGAFKINVLGDSPIIISFEYGSSSFAANIDRVLTLVRRGQN